MAKKKDRNNPHQVDPKMRKRIIQEGTPAQRRKLEKTDEKLMDAQEKGKAPKSPRKPGQG